MTNYALNKTTAYWTYGDSTLPTIIMIHGFRGTHHGLDLIAKSLPANHSVVPDLPGFGASQPLSDAHSLNNYVQWLHSFIADLKLSEPPVLLGHSFGSIITAAYASKYPKTISKLILVNPIGAPALEGPQAILTRLAIFYYLLGEKLPARAAQTWLSTKPIVMIMSNTMAKTKDKQLRDFIHNQHLQHFSSFASPKVVSEAFATSTKHTVRESATTVSTPTLLIAGDKDDITSLPKQKELVKLFPNATLKVIPGVGHLTHYETPDQVAALITDFIR
jgi:pimeloyl-ACP methyl ester carboxylesterase